MKHQNGNGNEPSIGNGYEHSNIYSPPPSNGNGNETNTPYVQTCLVVLNWASVSTLTSAFQTLQSKIMGTLVNSRTTDSHPHLGLMITPRYSYNKGHLYKDQHRQLEALLNCNINTDREFVLHFKDSHDQRDERLVTNRTLLNCIYKNH